MIRILLADDHSLVREGFRILLDAQSDFSVVGETHSGLQVTSLVERLQPDVLVVDIVLPDISGLEAARQLQQRFPSTKTVVLSMHANEAYVGEALRAGVAAYVLKEATSVELAHAIREVAAGRRYLSPALSEHVIEAYIRSIERDGKVISPVETLTTREREVLYLVATGRTNAEIGENLSISPRTVEHHRANMMRKLNLDGTAALIRFAVQHGILPPVE